MYDRSYNAFHESIEKADHDPVRFCFTEDEADRPNGNVRDYDVPMEETPLIGEVFINLSELGYPFLRAALIFEVFCRKT